MLIIYSLSYGSAISGVEDGALDMPKGSSGKVKLSSKRGASAAKNDAAKEVRPLPTRLTLTS